MKQRTRTILLTAAILLTGCDQLGTARKPAPGQARFVNSREGLSGPCTERYVDFLFDYPAGWEVKRQGPDNPQNYVKVSHRVNGKTVEQFNVGTMIVDDQKTDIIASLPELARGLVAELSKQAGEFQVTSQQSTRMAGLEGYEVRAINTLTPPYEPSRKVRLNFRIILLPDESKKRGVTIMMYEEEAAATGGLKVMTDSFRFGM